MSKDEYGGPSWDSREMEGPTKMDSVQQFTEALAPYGQRLGLDSIVKEKYPDIVRGWYAMPAECRALVEDMEDGLPIGKERHMIARAAQLWFQLAAGPDGLSDANDYFWQINCQLA